MINEDRAKGNAHHMHCETVSIRSYGSKNERDNWLRHLVRGEANILQGGLPSHADLVDCY